MLMTLIGTLEQKRRKTHQPFWKTTSVRFMRKGEKPPTTATARTNLRQKTQSWEMKVNLGGRLQFPQIIQ